MGTYASMPNPNALVAQITSSFFSLHNLCTRSLSPSSMFA